MAFTRLARAGLFSSPTMAARAHLVRALALLEELDRADARGDTAAAADLAGAADHWARAAGDALAWYAPEPEAEGVPAAGITAIERYQAEGR